MTTEAYLNQLKQDEKHLDLQEQLQSLYDRVMSITVQPKEVDVQTSHAKDSMERAIVMIVDTQRQIETEVTKDAQTKVEILNQLSEIDDPMHYKILSKRYIHNLRWSDIEDELGISHRHAMRLHKEALECFESMFGVIYL